MPLYSPLYIFLHVIYEIYFQRGGRGLLTKLPFPCFGRLYLTDIEVESSAVGIFDLLLLAAITLLIWGIFNKNVNSYSIMNSSKSKKEVSVYEIKLAAVCSTGFCLLCRCDWWHIDFILSINKKPLVMWFDISQKRGNEKKKEYIFY